MDTTSTIGLTDATVYPDEQVLRSVLGKSYDAYCRLLKLYDDYEMEYTWRYYRDGRAWLCKVQKKKRTIVWMSAWKGYVKATIYFPEKYIDEIYRLDISEEMIHRIKNTKNTGKSKPCIFEIRNTAILKDIGKVIEFKIAAK
ncbi:MAG TPA: DUF3788 family protein [Spirochaetota bacterium]|nr:DUF3788 family protein [Spirochaetota bacterium]HRZ28370.1 DUF3788 family protein [Spirochaetota bacterium]HSA15521.1 DUF3788 family protein [Spirochaetota bacterium]